MEKRTYEKPDMEIIKIEAEEIITTSKGELPVIPTTTPEQ